MSDNLYDQIRTLVTEVAWTADQDDLIGFNALITDDASVTAPGVAFTGRDAISSWMKGAMDSRVNSRHLILNLRVNLDGDKAATGTLAVQVMSVRPEGTTISLADYRDQYICGDDGKWRLAKRDISGFGAVNSA